MSLAAVVESHAATDRQTAFTALLAQKLADCKADIQQQWNHPTGTTTRSFCIDGVLPDALCKEIYAAFPRDANGFFSLDSFREKKRTSVNLTEYDPILADITYAFQDPAIVQQITAMLGMTKIEPDPMLYAGGLSMMFKDNFLNPHLDNSHDGKRSRYRRLNLLFYVSPDWALENGGNLELWNEDRTIPKTYVAQANRLVVMETTKTSWHSVSPVKVDRPRCCVSNYYFSEISPDATDYFHVTSFTGRPDEKLKRLFSAADNGLRNLVSKLLKKGRGQGRINKSKA